MRDLQVQTENVGIHMLCSELKPGAEEGRSLNLHQSYKVISWGAKGTNPTAEDKTLKQVCRNSLCLLFVPIYQASAQLWLMVVLWAEPGTSGMKHNITIMLSPQSRNSNLTVLPCLAQGNSLLSFLYKNES